MQNKPPRSTQRGIRDAPPQLVNSPSLVERLRAVPVEFDDPFAGQPYKPKRPPRLRSKGWSLPDPVAD